MKTVADLLPVLGLSISAGPLQLRGIPDEDLVALCALAERGIHDPDDMPFHYPWTDAPRGELARNTAAYHWRSSSTTSAPRRSPPEPSSTTRRPEDLVRGEHELLVVGLPAFRRSIGLDPIDEGEPT